MKCCNGNINPDCHWRKGITPKEIHNARTKHRKYKKVQELARKYEREKMWNRASIEFTNESNLREQWLPYLDKSCHSVDGFGNHHLKSIAFSRKKSREMHNKSKTIKKTKKKSIKKTKKKSIKKTKSPDILEDYTNNWPTLKGTKKHTKKHTKKRTKKR